MVSTRVNRRRVIVLVAAALTMLITARLGLWQLDRAAQKQDLHDVRIERAAQPPLDGAGLAGVAADAPTVEGQIERRVTVRGDWVQARTVFLDNRQMAGRPGFYVMTPLALADGTAVLVQRGWAPRHFERRDALPALPPARGEVWVSGRIAPPPGRLMDFGEAGSGRIRQNVELVALARETGLRLRPVTIRQTEPDRPVADAASGTAAGLASAAASGQPSPTDDGLRRDWPVPEAGIGKHQGYAFQWFALCALTAGLTLWFQFIRPRRFPPADGPL